MVLQVFVISFLVLFETVIGDTPANCTYDEIQGSWVFYAGLSRYDNTLKCDKAFKLAREFHFQLLFPDIVVDDEGNRGFWTMIYNQGFEVVVDGRKYFAFSKYSKSGAKVTSFCNQTMPGWSHDAQVVSKNWGCFYGKSFDESRSYICQWSRFFFLYCKKDDCK